VPQILDHFHFGEKTMATDIEPPPVAFRAAADAADDRVALEHRRRLAGLGELIRGG
jgi:hypothetical protein